MKKLQLLALAALVLTAQQSTAGPASLALADCLRKQTSGQDRIDLMNWFISGFSQHPDLVVINAVGPEEQEQINEKMTDLFTTLMLDRCKAEAETALSKDGNSALEVGFGALGETASLELANHRRVRATLMKFADGLDQTRFAELFKTGKN